MRAVSDDWLSRTIRTVEAVMERHGFVEDNAPQLNASLKQPKSRNALDWNNLLRRFNLLLPFVS